MTPEHGQGLTAGDIPEPCRAVRRGRHHLLPVGAEDGVRDPTLMSIQVQYFAVGNDGAVQG